MGSKPERGVVVADLPSEASARVVAGRLEADGIEAFVTVDASLAPYQYVAPAHVLVRPEDETAARAALASAADD